ncbi:hypothetical protein TRM7557_02839 [Tritonibacter multivorans]|uniref:Uncharacterized protein n=1 Tax=Tritonibacter multivorans TaxID=928856 RepID=A0A0N7M0F6_9RHOB|nr:hypothetical protein [Tritonibacter multivorans]MDA7421023.1 hypothetical protein [Tritonibacter multivorans]CUH80329.1 hypothetical protein TRM7557_02839 [Tritonibacter multivorans]SFC78172.1 hypothetical protein SAMN04488049_104122 [Tritonibacter multivorans]
MPDVIEQAGADLPPFTYEGDARSLAALLGLGAWLLLLAVLWLVVGATWWVLAILALPAAPALWEIMQNPKAELSLDSTQLRWSCPRSEGEILVSEIERVALTTRWDFSTRTTIHTKPGTRHNLPPAVQPPGHTWEEVLKSRGIAVTRQHFTSF